MDLRVDASSEVRDALVAEHEAIDALLGEAMNSVAAPAGGLDRCWHRFARALTAQLDAEDELVAALPYGPDARVLVLEHRYIRARLSELGESGRRGELGSRELKTFRDVLRAHARNDDRLLYVWAEGALSAEHRASVLEAVARRIAATTSS